jgi:hypothetical protein
MFGKGSERIMQQIKEYEVYIVISQTGTFLSRLLKFITKAEYNHASLSLDRTLGTMYSFGRVNPYNPVVGGFVMESPHWGTFKRFQETEAVVLRVPVTEQQYLELQAYLAKMYGEKQKYHYNYLGLFLAWFSIAYQQENAYYCSEFVRDTLDRFAIVDAQRFEKIVKPENFLHVIGDDVVYTGNLQEYAMQEKNF